MNRADPRVRAELARVLFQHSPIPVAANFAVVALAVIALWRHAAHGGLLAWGGALYAVALARIGMSIAFHRAPPPPERLLAWAWIYAILAGATGSLWGGLAIWAHDPAEPMTLVFIGVVIAGLVGGSVASLSTFPPAFYLYSVPTLAPFAWLALTDGRLPFWIALVLMCLNFSYARVLFRKAREAVELRFVNQDLSDQLAAEKGRVEAASRAKSVFLASASHDLRQPVHAMSLFVERLRGEELTASQRDTVERIARSVQAMDDLFNALLDVSRLDARAVRPEPRHFPLSRTLERVRAGYAELAARKGLRFTVEDCDAIVVSDPLLLERIVQNLVENAVRYTDSGEVRVACGAAGGRVRIEVRDTGPGIPAARQQEVFQEFVQLQNPERDRRKGLGLGLAIVERLARLLDHALALESQPGRGSVFSLELAEGELARVAQPEPPLAEPAGDFAGALVAVVDDEQDVREAMRDLLERWGCEVACAASGEELMSRLAASARAPDALVCDYRLRDGETGTMVIERLREEFNAAIPALMVTGDTAPIGAGAPSDIGVLHKPLQPARLRAALRNMLRRTGPPAAG